MTEHGDAIIARREAIAAEPRPSRRTDVDLAAEVAQVRETDDLWRVYHPEWVIVFTATASGSDPEIGLVAACSAHFDATYAGRVHEGTWAIEVTGDGPTAMARLKLRMPVLKGEFKTRAYAEEFVQRLGWSENATELSIHRPSVCCWVVPRNSRSDHSLRAYGTKRLGRG